MSFLDPTTISNRVADGIGYGLLGALLAGVASFEWRAWRRRRQRKDAPPPPPTPPPPTP